MEEEFYLEMEEGREREGGRACNRNRALIMYEYEPSNCL